MSKQRVGALVLALILVAFGSLDCCRKIYPVYPKYKPSTPTRTATRTVTSTPGVPVTTTATYVYTVPVSYTYTPQMTWTRTPTPTLTNTYTIPVTYTATYVYTAPVSYTYTPQATWTRTSTTTATWTRTSTTTPTRTNTYAASVTTTATYFYTPPASITATAQATATHTSTLTTTSTAMPQSTATTTATVFYQGGLGIYLDATATGYSSAVSFTMLLRVNGTGETTATGSLVGPGVNITLGNIGPGAYAQYGDMGTGYGDAFQDGQSYTLTLNTSLGTVSRTLLAPGKATVSSDGSTASWSPESDTDRLWVIRGTSTYYAPNPGNNLNSPFAIPGSAYPTSGTYQVTVWTTNEGGIAGTDPATLFRLTQTYTGTVVK